MQHIHSDIDLKNAIAQLENQQVAERLSLKEALHSAQQSLKPINLIKGVFQEISDSPVMKHDLLNTSIGLATGYLTKKVFVKVSHNPFKKILGNALMLGITNIISKNPEKVKSIGSGILNTIRKTISRKKPKPVDNDVW